MCAQVMPASSGVSVAQATWPVVVAGHVSDWVSGALQVGEVQVALVKCV